MYSRGGLGLTIAHIDPEGKLTDAPVDGGVVLLPPPPGLVPAPPPTHQDHHLHPELLEEGWRQWRQAMEAQRRAPRVSMPTGDASLTDDAGFDFGSVLPYIAIGGVLLLVMKMK